MTAMPGIDPTVPPSGTGCVECDLTVESTEPGNTMFKVCLPIHPEE